MPTPARASTIWDGGGGDGNWGTGANWSDDLTPPTGATVDLTFAGIAGLASVNNYTAFDDFRSLTFDATAGSFNVSGNAIDIFGKIENYSTATQTVSLSALAINAGQPGTGEFNPVNGDLVITSTDVFTNGNTLHVYGTSGKTVTFGAGTAISQAGHFNVEQASNVVFLGANTYTGTTNVLAGSLTVGNGGTSGQLGTGTATVLAGATLSFNRSDTTTVSNVLAGAGAFVKAGAGTLTLGGANTFTGTLTVSNGTVSAAANTSALGAGSIVLGDANTGASNVAFLTTTAGTSRPITVSANGAGTATIGSTTGAGAGNVSFGGLITLNRATTITAASTDRTSWTGKITGNVGTLTFAGGQRTVLENVTNDFVGDIVVTGTNTVLQTGVVTGTEHIPNGSSLTINTGATVKLAGVGGSVETINALNGTGTMRRHEGVGGTQTLVLGSAGGSGSFGGALLNGSGFLALTKAGAGTQTITSTANTAGGGVVVSGGTLALTGAAGFNVGSFSGATTYTVNTGSTLSINGDWLTNNTSTYNVNAGTLAFTKTTGDVTLSYVNAINLTDGTITGPGAFRTGFFANPNITAAGDAGSTIASNFNLVNDVDVSGVRVLTLNVANGAADNDLTISGIISDLGTHRGEKISKTGNGKLTLTRANTYTGQTTVSAGQLRGTANTAFGSGAIVIGDTASNASLYLGNRADISNPITVSALGSGTVVIGADNTGTGADAATITGLLTLNRATTLSGEIAADRLGIDGRITGNVGTLTVTGGSRVTFLSTLNDFTGNIVVTGAGTVLQASVATAAETIPNGSSVTVDAGAVLQLASSSGAETINALNGAGTVRTFLTGTFGSGLVVGSAGGSGTFSGVLQNGTIGNPLSFTKTGGGTETLSGASTYTGTTTVSGGTLVLTGSLTGTPTMDVQSGATFDVSGVPGGFALAAGQTLKGTGTILGATTVNGTLAPGASPGTLTFNDALTFGSSGALALEIGGTSAGQFDKLTGITNLTLDGTFTVSLFGGFNPVPGNSFDVLDWSGTLNATGFNVGTDLILPGLTLDYTWDTAAFTTTGILAVVPEPSAMVSLFAGLGILSTRRRTRGA